jgi:hypothetical protein
MLAVAGHTTKTNGDESERGRFQQKIRDGVGELLAQVAAGEISPADAQRELDICKAFAELMVIAFEELGVGTPCSPEEEMRREAALIEMWPEACRRAGVGVVAMPTDILRHIARAGGRAS